MFIIHMPRTFSPGDSAKVIINGETAKLSWRDGSPPHLIINDNDAREILQLISDGALRCFVCADAKAEVAQ